MKERIIRKQAERRAKRFFSKDKTKNKAFKNLCKGINKTDAYLILLECTEEEINKIANE